MKRIFLVLLALASCSTAWGSDEGLLTPEPYRITDEAIAADIRVMKTLQGRLADLNNRGIPIASYHFAKAQAWLDFAMDEYTVNDRSRVVEEALHQALSLIEQMEAGKKEIGMSTPIIATSSTIRTDLWDKAETLKKLVSPRCAGDKIAQLEVQLVWAGHENKEFDWRHAKPYLQAAERLAREADEQMAACPPEPPASGAVKSEPTMTKVDLAAVTLIPQPAKAEPAAMAKIEPAAAAIPETMAIGTVQAASEPGPAEAAETAEPAMMPPASHIVTMLAAQAPCIQLKCPESVPAAFIAAQEPLPDRIHFALDRSEISTASSAVLGRIAAAMKGNQALRVVLFGHADQRGNLYYNMVLSRQRADNVRVSLARAGIPADRIAIAPFGKLRPLTRENSVEAYARNRRVEFFFTVGPPQPLVHQQEDLQPEIRASQLLTRATRDGN